MFPQHCSAQQTPKAVYKATSGPFFELPPEDRFVGFSVNTVKYLERTRNGVVREVLRIAVPVSSVLCLSISLTSLMAILHNVNERAHLIKSIALSNISELTVSEVLENTK